MGIHFIFIDYRTNIVKMTNLPKSIYIFNSILIKIPISLFTKVANTIYPKIHMELQKTLDSQNNQSRKNNVGGITIPDIKIYYKATAIKNDTGTKPDM